MLILIFIYEEKSIGICPLKLQRSKLKFKMGMELAAVNYARDLSLTKSLNSHRSHQTFRRCSHKFQNNI